MKILILSDIHGNWPALQAVLAAEPDADEILCLGDLVNYGPQPRECVEWAMELNPSSRIIQGNHDRAFGLGVPQRGDPACQAMARAMQSATDFLLTSEMKHFLGDLKPFQRFQWNETFCIACHTVSERLGGCCFTERDDPAWQYSDLSRMESDMILLGHPDWLFVLLGHPDFVFISNLHSPTKTKFYGTIVVNPGSVGFPTDGDPRAAYAIWQDAEIIFRRLAYDVEETVKAYDPLNLDKQIKQELADSLRTGKAATGNYRIIEGQQNSKSEKFPT